MFIRNFEHQDKSQIRFYKVEPSIIDYALAKYFPNIVFEDSDTDSEHTADIDYIGKVGNKGFGIQIRIVRANSKAHEIKPSERMQAAFESFKEKYGGKVFIIFSMKVGNKKVIQNKDVLTEITKEIASLTSQQ